MSGSRREVEVEHNGKTYKGEWTLHRKMITVRCWINDANKEKTTQLGGMPPKALAQILLREIVDGI